MALLVITVSGIGHAVVNGVNGAINRVDAFGGMQGRPDGRDRLRLDPAQIVQEKARCDAGQTLPFVERSVTRSACPIGPRVASS